MKTRYLIKKAASAIFTYFNDMQGSDAYIFCWNNSRYVLDIVYYNKEGDPILFRVVIKQVACRCQIILFLSADPNDEPNDDTKYKTVTELHEDFEYDSLDIGRIVKFDAECLWMRHNTDLESSDKTGKEEKHG